MEEGIENCRLQFRRQSSIGEHSEVVQDIQEQRGSIQHTCGQV